MDNLAVGAAASREAVVRTGEGDAAALAVVAGGEVGRAGAAEAADVPAVGGATAIAPDGVVPNGSASGWLGAFFG